MTAYLFPGQGSQFTGMGNGLFTLFPEITLKANEILGYSIERLCLENTKNNLHQTCYTQPALYVVNTLAYLKKTQKTGQIPDFVAGHSLGEYSALFAAGVFDFETGLKLVQKRGELMQKAKGGAMAAILGLKLEEIKKIIEKNNLHYIAIANHNCYTQVVLSGPREEIGQIKTVFEQENAIFVPLAVSGAFHSRYMNFAQEQFKIFLQNFSFFPPKIPVFSNYTAQPYKEDNIAFNLVQQITHTVRWTEIIEFLKIKGERKFEEIGPGTVLTGLLKRIQNGQ